MEQNDSSWVDQENNFLDFLTSPMKPTFELFGQYVYIPQNLHQEVNEEEVNEEVNEEVKEEVKEEELVEKENEESQQLTFDNIVDFNNLTFENDLGQSFMSHDSDSPDQPPLCIEDPLISGNFLFPFSFSLFFFFEFVFVF